jgi:hypothetical protein
MTPFALVGRRLLAAAVALFVLVSLAPGGQVSRASAFESWCFDDPVLVVGGQSIHFAPGVPEGQRHLIRGSTLTVTVPSNVSAYLAGVNAKNFPLTVSIVRGNAWDGRGAIPVSATATVYGPSGIPTALKAWASSGGLSTMTTATTGVPMTVAVGVAQTFGSTTSTAGRTR